MADGRWRITVAEVGALDVPRSVLSSGADSTLVRVPVLMWILRSTDSVVIVDTGIHERGSSEAGAHPRPITQSASSTPLGVLDRLGIDPAQVSIVVNTHLHWDHCANNELFANAEIFIQEQEIIASLNPPEGQDLSFESARVGMRPPWLKAFDRTVPVAGDRVIADGLELMLLPGHTPGSQGVLVTTERGRVLLAGDLVPVDDNFSGPTATLPGILSSARQAEQSLQRARALGVPVLSAHQVPAGARAIGAGIWDVDLDANTETEDLT